MRHFMTACLAATMAISMAGSAFAQDDEEEVQALVEDNGSQLGNGNAVAGKKNGLGKASDQGKANSSDKSRGVGTTLDGQGPNTGGDSL
ncbi:hypothetical protein [Aliiruegeria sabulilitoris]|uniref:hypothetical protein n=1 Tax=Aliiruegeria sabulilitoris TaxID=1510458 RepID=UPI0008333618|nr:hypothetical protein [Aliiruegeria sabulilitoris]NDR55190.1 hypothetical protein [Pseudoruegeria sp. M32A2M]